MFGIMEALLGFIRRQIGLRDDAASATGSAHAKLTYVAGKDIVANGSAIKSIQRGTISLSTSQNSNTATISAVTTAKTMLNFLGVSVGSEHYGQADYALTGHQFCYLVLTNTTTVTATRAENNGIAMVASYEVIEFY